MADPGKLYIVATPIGNLEDITLRAIRILGEVSLIAAEDTRRTRILLRHYNINTPLTSLYEQNESMKSPVLIERIKAGENIACVTDAGTPAVSDPGYLLVRSAIAAGVEVAPVPGASALITALCISGLPLDHFVFQGFLPDRKGKKKAALQSLLDDRRTQIFYESPNRLLATLKEIQAILGNRFVVVARELTKVYEEVIRGDIAEVIQAFEGKTIKGEITLIVAGSVPEEHNQACELEIIQQLDMLNTTGDLSMRDMVDRIATKLSLSRKRVYEIVHRRLKS